ncbi:hypothetical protein G9C98_002123 [Cotesia typhae]|uniref:Glycosyltransferase family 92 protein n=1 Tax=Cotesia typhae TaxID=2053667 RepID=A0A8J5QSI3_9HYME|nr:hypothetical protein G9C98_002123 [Cotesia typhae]
MAKYHLLINSRPPIRFFRKHAKKIMVFSALNCVFYLIYARVEISKFSKLKDISVSRALDLITEVKTLPFAEESEDSWKEPDIKGSRIYSAYLETRSQVVLEENRYLIYNDSTWAFIRIVGIIPVNLNSPLTCYYEYAYSNRPLKKLLIKKPSIRTQFIAKPENFGMYYSAAFILCPLAYPEEVSSRNIKLPYRVTVSTRADRRDHQIDGNEFVVIRYPKKWHQLTIDHDEFQPAKTFSVCVKPFHHNFDKTLDLVTFIEFYRLMGVNHLTFYRDSVSENVDKILNYYVKQKVVTLLKWKLPEIYVFQKTLRTDGIFAALNDCLYRNTFHEAMEYVIGIDVDEYIVPRIHQNYSEMMEVLNAVPGEETGVWIIRNVFYYLMYDDDVVTLPRGSPKLTLHYKTTRLKEANPVYERSKYIAQGKNVVELGNHRAWKTKKTWSIFGTRYKQVEVDPIIATSNHYRLCETEIDECWKRETIIDRTTYKFTEELSDRVSKVLKELNLGQ